jgi:hypothetical protein
MVHHLQVEHMTTFESQLQSLRTRAPRKRWLLLLVGALSFSLLPPISAQTPPAASPDSTASVSFVHGESGGAGQQNTNPFGFDAVVPTFTDPDTQDLQFGSGSASVTSNAIPGFGTGLPDLRAFAHALPNGNAEGVSASATFSDNLEFFAPAVNTVKVFHLNFLVTGSLSGNSEALFTASWGNIDSNGILVTTDGTVAQEITLSVPSSDLTLSDTGDDTMVGGFLTLTLGASANNTIPNSLQTEDSMSDFSNTVQLISADALDANGDAVQGSFTDDDQLLFPANTVLVATPEPATFLLLAPVLCLLVAFGRKLPRSGKSV